MRKITQENFSIYELLNIHKHLRLGVGHLKNYLNQQQFCELINSIKINSKQYQHLQPSGTEKSGNFSMVFNTLITGILGGWLGTSGFLETGLGSKLTLLLVTIIAAFSSSGLGYYNFKLTKRQASEAIIKQKLLTMQRQILHLIIKKRYQAIHKNSRYLAGKLQDFDPEILESSQKITTKNLPFISMSFWAHKMIKIIQTILSKLPTYSFSTLYANKLLSLKKSLQKFTSDHETLLPSAAPSESCAEALTRPVAITSKLETTPVSWLRHNYTSLVVSFLPVMFGGFGSMFVYLDGIPKFMQSFETFQNLDFTKTPTVKITALLFAIAITAYLAYSTFQTNRKSYLRSLILEKTQQKITKLELRLSKANKKLSLLKKLRDKINSIEFIYFLIKKIPHYPSEFEKQI